MPLFLPCCHGVSCTVLTIFICTEAQVSIINVDKQGFWSSGCGAVSLDKYLEGPPSH